MPKIYAFSNVVGGGYGSALAMAEDGNVLAQHWCSHEGYVPHDLGVTSGWKHEQYKAHYPDGYEMEFVPADDIDDHAGLQAAFVLNAAMGAAAAAAEKDAA